MDRIFIAAASSVTEAGLSLARLGSRAGRLDLQSRMALLAVEELGLDFDALPRDRIGICLATRAGSLATDAEYWKDRDAVGGPSPTLFAYTLPSAAIGEIAIRHRLTGPNLCFVGADGGALREAAELIWAGEAEGCICVACNVVTAEAARLTGRPTTAAGSALYLSRSGGLSELREFDRDIASLCALICGPKCAD
jgi:3-oxoacyl-(acyl-carrier-protein) synthase